MAAAKDSDPKVSNTAQTFLRGVPTLRREDLPTILAALTAKEESIRLLGVALLGKADFDKPVIVKSLKKCLADNSPAVRKLTIETLGKFGADAIEAAKEIGDMVFDKNRDLSLAAFTALGNLGHSASPALPSLLDAFHNPRLENLAEGTLVKIGKPAAAALIEKLETLSVRDKRRIIPVLGKMGPEAQIALPVLTRISKTSGPFPHLGKDADDAIRAIKK